VTLRDDVALVNSGQDRPHDQRDDERTKKERLAEQ
jgi:hypothetical protein